MKHPLQIAALAGIMFIGPNSEALLSNVTSSDMENAGYHCTLGRQQSQKIHITYKPHDVYIKTCEVSFQENSDPRQSLWQEQRSTYSCESKAAALAVRLIDRGWECRTAGLTLNLL